jgi:hypothetical protein
MVVKMRDILDLMAGIPPNQWVVYHTGYLPKDKKKDEYLVTLAQQALMAQSTGQYVLAQRLVKRANPGLDFESVEVSAKLLAEVKELREEIARLSKILADKEARINQKKPFSVYDYLIAKVPVDNSFR